MTALRLYSLAAVAACGGVISLAWMMRDRVHSPDTEFAELVVAARQQATRPGPGRPAGGFAYAPTTAVTRGAVERQDGFRLRIAADRVVGRALHTEDALTRSWAGVAHLFLDDPDEAITALEASVAAAPAPESEASLSAAYLQRGLAHNAGADFTSALAAANRSLQRGTTLEGLFNRAVSLELLALNAAAADAWRDYLEADASSPWRKEATSRLQVLTAAFSPGSGVETNRQALREDLEEQRLSRWGAAVLAERAAEAAAELKEARGIATELAAAGGDAMAALQIGLIDAAIARGDRAAVRAFAQGHILYAEAHGQLRAANQAVAAETMEKAARQFRVVQSPYAGWAPVMRAIALRVQGKAPEAIALLTDTNQAAPSFLHLRGRRHWALGVALGATGRFDLDRVELEHAIEAFSDAGELTHMSTVQAILAEATALLGDTTAAWTALLDTLRNAARGRAGPGHVHLSVAARLALNADQPEAALEFQGARLAVVKAPRGRAETFIQRARTFAALGRLDRALADLAAAEESTTGVAGADARTRLSFDIAIARSEAYVETDAAKAVEIATAALPYVSEADPAIRLASLYAVRASARQRLGDIGGAEDDLKRSIEFFDAKRRALSSVQDRMAAFNEERPAFEQLIGLQSVHQRRPEEARRTSERARLGIWNRPDEPTSTADVDGAIRTLPHDVAVVQFEVLTDRVLAWAMDRDRLVAYEYSIPRRSLEQAIARLTARVSTGASLAELQDELGGYFRHLIAPALPIAAGKRALVIIPDDCLYELPFAALTDASGTPLLDTWTPVIAPSLTAFAETSSKLSRFRATSALAFGDGHDPATTGLPYLRGADDEAAAIAALYTPGDALTGQRSRANRLLESDHEVTHFAGHTVINRHLPLLSQMFFAGGSGADANGAVTAAQVVEQARRGSRVVVLATCEAAAGGVVPGEGLVGLSRAFLAAGASSVVASIWPVDDANAPFFVEFHRTLRETLDPATALQHAQLASFRKSGPGGPLKAWAGFTSLGGQRAPVR